MDKHDTTFEVWFSCLQVNLLDAGVDFHDEDSVIDDYKSGKNMYDVVDEIVAEYGGTECE